MNSGGRFRTIGTAAKPKTAYCKARPEKSASCPLALAAKRTSRRSKSNTHPSHSRTKAMKALKYPVVISIALLLLGSGAIAQQGPFASACGADVKTFCADVKPGEGRIRDCV